MPLCALERITEGVAECPQISGKRASRVHVIQTAGFGGGEKDSFEGFGNVQHQGLEGEEAKDRLGLASGERC